MIVKRKVIRYCRVNTIEQACIVPAVDEILRDYLKETSGKYKNFKYNKFKEGK